MSSHSSIASGCLPVAAIVLAAGAATRMGRLKQLLSFGGQAFVQRAIGTARAAGFDPVVVVLGAEADAVQACIASQNVVVVRNANWQSGMGSSVAAGVRQLQQDGSEAGAVAILLADQPLVEPAHLQAMRRELFQNGAAIVAAEYNDTLGVPAIFRRSLFGTLAHLPPEAGARRLFADQQLKIGTFPLPEAAFDIDTPADFAALQARVGGSL